MNQSTPDGVSSTVVKSCCARLYEQDIVRQLLGDSYHPGGLGLTSRLGELMDLTPESRVLDVASGNGSSALHLARTYGCEVVGIDYGVENVKTATGAASDAGLTSQVRFEVGDSERLPVPDESFDGILCECAFCTFPDKAAAAMEFHRVLRPRGVVALSDVTRAETLPVELGDLMAWVACIAEAQPLSGYQRILEGAGFKVEHTSSEDGALEELVQQIRTRLFGLQIATGLKKLDLPGIDLPSASQMARSALNAIEEGHLGYGIVVGMRA